MKREVISVGDVHLTERELAVLRLVAQGQSNKEIAERMALAESTIEHMLCNDWSDKRAIYPKLGVRSRAEAAVWYARTTGAGTGQAPDEQQGADRSNPRRTPSTSHVSDDRIPRMLVDDGPKSFAKGAYALLTADVLRTEMRCRDALQYFTTATDIFGAASSQSARAACKVVQMYIELGNLEQAQEELERVTVRYARVMDPETRAELYRTYGWLAYNQDERLNALRWFRRSLALADEAGMEQLGRHAHHFLGQIATDWARRNTAQQTHWAAQAVVHFDTAYRLDRIWGGEANQGFDLLRKAQLLQAQRQHMEAVTLRTQVRHLFAGTILVAHLEYEEAKVALLNRSATRQTLHTVETTLQTWAGVNNANGMAGALYLQGLAAYFQGQAVHALDRFIASMCLAAPSPLRNRRIWPIIQDILRHNGSSRLGYHLHEIQERAENHTGSFAYLDQITADRSAHMTDIFGRLHPMITREAQK